MDYEINGSLNVSKACVAIKGTKKLPFSVVWFNREGVVAVESIETSLADGVTSLASGTAGDLSVGEYGFAVGTGETVLLAFNGKKFTSNAGVSVKYTAATGEFSGSYKESYMNAKGKARTRTVKFNGVFVDGVGYGIAKTSTGTLDVTIAPVK